MSTKETLLLNQHVKGLEIKNYRPEVDKKEVIKACAKEFGKGFVKGFTITLAVYGVLGLAILAANKAQEQK